MTDESAMSFDQYDLRILQALQKDGSLTNGALSELVRLSPSQCSRRRAALEAAGIIRGYHAKLNATKLGFSMRAIVRVTLKTHTKDDHQNFSHWLGGQPEVLSAFSVTGSADYILDVRVRDLENFSDFLHERLLIRPQVGHVQSDLVLKTLKDIDELNLAELGAL
jgi:DNA-binding Lrp family transcriptional regulator